MHHIHEIGSMVEINPMLASRSDGGEGRPSGPLYPSPLTLTTLTSSSSSPTTKKAAEKQSPTKEKVKKVGGMLSFLMHGGHSSSSPSSSAVRTTDSGTGHGAGPKPENGGKYMHPADDPHRVKSANVDLENIYNNSKYDNKM